jgi:hypothetical protein
MTDLVRQYLPSPLVAINLPLLNVLDREWENLRAATNLAIQEAHPCWPELVSRIWIYELQRSRDPDALARFELLGDRLSALPDRLRGWIFHGVGVANFRRHQIEKAGEYLEIAQRLCRSTGQLGLATVIENYRRYTVASGGLNSEEFIAGGAERRERAASDPSPTALGRTLAYEGCTLYSAQRADLAIEVLQESARISNLIRDEPTRSLGSYMLALSLAGEKRYEEALTIARSFKDSVLALKDLRWIAYQGGLESWLLYTLNQYEAAERGFLQVRDWWTVLEDRNQLGSTQNCLARVYLETGQGGKALDYARASFEAYRLLNSPRAMLAAAHSLAEYHRIFGAPEEGLRILRIAMRLAQDDGIKFPPVEETYRQRLIQDFASPEPCVDGCTLERLGEMFAAS